MADAACLEHPGLSWFPARGDDVREVKAVCASCLVRDECAAAGEGERFGIWAGESARDRELIRSSGHRTAA
jgi:WhiB family redox-sensing transcriptional regulator